MHASGDGPNGTEYIYIPPPTFRLSAAPSLAHAQLSFSPKSAARPPAPLPLLSQNTACRYNVRSKLECISQSAEKWLPDRLSNNLQPYSQFNVLHAIGHLTRIQKSQRTGMR